MFSYFIFSFKDVQDFFSGLPFCWIKHTAFSESLAVMYHERLQLFEELNLIKREKALQTHFQISNLFLLREIWTFQMFGFSTKICSILPKHI